MITASVNLIPEGPIQQMIDLARQAERLGFERCWVYDEGLATRDVYVTMTAIAAATDRIKIGPGITNPYTRHPGQTAAAIASLDEASGGRAFLGIGAGGSLTLGPLAIARERPLRAVRETMEICRALLSGSIVDFEGEFATLRNARIDFPPAELEIWLAGRGPRMLELGGSVADGVMLDFIHKDLMSDYISLVRQGAAAAGRDPQLCYATMIITDDDTLDSVKPHMTYRLVDSQPAVRRLLGVTDRDVDAIRTSMADGLDAAAVHVRDEWVAPFVIHGTRDECRAELEIIMDRHGFSEFMLPVVDLGQAESMIDRVAAVLS